MFRWIVLTTVYACTRRSWVSMSIEFVFATLTAMITESPNRTPWSGGPLKVAGKPGYIEVDGKKLSAGYCLEWPVEYASIDDAPIGSITCQIAMRPQDFGNLPTYEELVLDVVGSGKPFKFSFRNKVSNDVVFEGWLSA